jgi:hypothetical protein
MTPSYPTKTLVSFLLFTFAVVSAKGKIVQAFSTPLPNIPYGFRSYTQLPINKAFQITNTFLLKSNSSHRRGKGKTALPVL